MLLVVVLDGDNTRLYSGCLTPDGHRAWDLVTKGNLAEVARETLKLHRETGAEVEVSVPDLFYQGWE